MTIQWPQDTTPPDNTKAVDMIDTDDLKQLPGLNPGYLFIVGLQHRPNVPEFCVELEETYFPPGTDKNDEFNFIVIQYPPGELAQLWPCCIVPSQYEAQARMVASKLGLVMVCEAVPYCVVIHKGERATPEFPLPTADNVFTLKRV